MHELPKILQDAIGQFSKLPGVGEKTATRQILLMSNWPYQEIVNFSLAMKELTELRKCQECGMFADGDKCHVCLSPERALTRSICVVEDIVDCMAIQKSEQFNGLYHVLGGVLNPLLGIGPDELFLDQLIQRVKKLDIAEVILALNPSVEGDATCSYLKQVLPNEIKVERIGFGIPIGGSLEYLDSMTISKALENKKMM